MDSCTAGASTISTATIGKSSGWTLRSSLSSRRSSAGSHQSAVARRFVHSPQLLHQEGRVAERVAPDPGPVDTALLVDQDRLMQLHPFEIVVGMEAVRVGEMIVR